MSEKSQNANDIYQPRDLTPTSVINVLEYTKRTFPHVTDEEKTDFIHRTNEMSGLPLVKSDIADYFIQNKNKEPAITGQIAAIKLALNFAPRPDLIPNTKVSEIDFDAKYPWFRKINLNILGDYVDRGTLYLFNRCEQTIYEIQSYRKYDIETFFGVPPRPIKIRMLLAEAFHNYATVYNKYRTHFDNPRMLDRACYDDLENAIRRLTVNVCTIKPVMDGNNRTARILENLLRLNIGLPFYTFTNDDLTGPIRDRYRSYYRKYSPLSMPGGSPDHKITL